MANKSKNKCLFCGEIFTADVRNRGRQKYCSKPKCQRQSEAASQRRWLKKPQNRSTSAFVYFEMSPVIVSAPYAPQPWA
jgi:hypothetical protein